jgi:LysM repeat protein
MIIRDLIIKEHRVLTEAQARAQLMEDPVFRQFRSIGHYITERKMTDSEILQVFADVEAGMTDKATGANRTWAGSTKDYAMDFAGGVKDAYDSIINSIQSNASVAAVDVAYNQATDALAKVAGGQNGAVMNAIKKYRMLAKEYPKTAGFAKAALVAIAGLATGGAGLPIIAGLTYALDSAIKGDKLSSVIGKGAGAAALSYVGQAAYGAYGGQAGAGVGDGTAMGDTTPSISGGQDIGGYNPDNVPGDLMTTPEPGWQSNADVSGMYAQEPGWPGSGAEGAGGSTYTVTADDFKGLGKIAQDNGLTAQQLWDANPQITDPNKIFIGQEINIPAAGGEPVKNVWQDWEGPTKSTAPAVEPGPSDTVPALPPASGQIGAPFNSGNAPIGPNGQPMRLMPMDDGPTNLTKDFDPANVPAGMTMKQGASPVSSQGFTGTSVAGMPVIPGQPLNPTQIAVSDMALKMGNQLSPVVQAAYDLAKNSAVKESVWSKVAESVKFKTLPVDRLIDDRITILSWALNESIGRKSKSINLSTVGVYTVFENIDRYRKAILGERLPSTVVGPGREQLPDYGRPDAPGAPAPVTPAAKKGWVGKGLDWVNKAAGKVGGALGTLGHQFTTNVTKEKLKMNWQLKGRPSESDQLSAWLVTQGVPQQVITTVYNKMGIPHTAPAATPAATGTAPTAATTDVAKNYNASLARNPFAKTSATVTPPPAPPAPGAETPPASPAPGAETPPASPAPGAQLSDVQIANYVRDIAKASDETLSGIAAKRNLNPRFKAIADIEIAKRASRPASAPTTPGVNPKTQRDARQLAKGPLKWKSRQPSVQPTSVGEEDDYHDALANREADREAEEKNLKKLPRSAFESLSWSKNFNPGMTLFRQMKREQS